MDAYFAAKMRLFDEVVADDGTAVVWTDDPRSDEVIERAKARGLKLITVGRAGETIRAGQPRADPARPDARAAPRRARASARACR